ncbi:MAG: hypothetical protein GY820_44450 [Gammaproteobacteria bacterium]|nr:hypothetical protein [Gammaproteobacteria bacterium]
MCSPFEGVCRGSCPKLGVGGAQYRLALPRGGNSSKCVNLTKLTSAFEMENSIEIIAVDRQARTEQTPVNGSVTGAGRRFLYCFVKNGTVFKKFLSRLRPNQLS